MRLIEEALSDHMVVKLVFRVVSGPREKVGICYSASVMQILEKECEETHHWGDSGEQQEVRLAHTALVGPLSSRRLQALPSVLAQTEGRSEQVFLVRAWSFGQWHSQPCEWRRRPMNHQRHVADGGMHRNIVLVYHAQTQPWVWLQLFWVIRQESALLSSPLITRV